MKNEEYLPGEFKKPLTIKYRCDIISLINSKGAVDYMSAALVFFRNDAACLRLNCLNFFTDCGTAEASRKEPLMSIRISTYSADRQTGTQSGMYGRQN